MLLSIIRYIKGYLRIKIIGYSPERFLNLCRHHHIYLWGLTPRMHDYEMFISISGFEENEDKSCDFKSIWSSFFFT